MNGDKDRTTKCAKGYKMKITDVKATTLKGFKQWNYARIETDEGLTGLGEAHPGSGVADIIKQFKGALVGKDPLNIEPLYNQMIGAARNRYAMGLSAIGGIEAALWDLKGKILETPVYQLLGGIPPGPYHSTDVCRGS